MNVGVPRSRPLKPRAAGACEGAIGSFRLNLAAEGKSPKTVRMCGSRGHIPNMLRHTFVTTMLDADVDLRDVQIAACHADPRTTMRYDRARKNLDRHPQLHPGRVHGLRHVTPPARGSQA
jgi:integrase/recombinase XerD